MLKLKNFDEYANHIFIPYVASQFHKVTPVDLVCDRYIQDSLKGTVRTERGKEVRRHVVAEATIPSNWKTSFGRTETRLSSSNSCLTLLSSPSIKKASRLSSLMGNPY